MFLLPILVATGISIVKENFGKTNWQLLYVIKNTLLLNFDANFNYFLERTFDFHNSFSMMVYCCTPLVKFGITILAKVLPNDLNAIGMGAFFCRNITTSTALLLAFGQMSLMVSLDKNSYSEIEIIV